ncbi:hypothetical protein J6590_014425 [Homalodisca vitripennis]|nr:hypothetical protein J6590_014425 [Homalodisca vitripennis]
MLENLPSLFRLSKQLNCTSLKICNVFNVTLLNRTNIVSSVLVPARTTMVVKRRYPPGLYREGNRPRLSRKTFFYELVEDTDYRPDPLVDVVLKTNVPVCAELELDNLSDEFAESSVIDDTDEGPCYKPNSMVSTLTGRPNQNRSRPMLFDSASSSDEDNSSLITQPNRAKPRVN